MTTPSETISLDSIRRQLPSGVRESALDDQIAYIRRKTTQFKMLYWLGMGMAVIMIVLTAVTFLMPELDPQENLVLSIVIVVAFIGASFGNRKMAQRYKDFQERLEQERGTE